jgi:hypothetical protein
MMDHAGPAVPGTQGGNTLLLVISWLWVGIPLAWGVFETLWSSMALFH